VKPLLDELVELLRLRQSIQQLFFIVEPYRRRRGFPVDQQIRFSVFPIAFYGLLELVFGTRFDAGAIRAGEFLWQRSRHQYRRASRSGSGMSMSRPAVRAPTEPVRARLCRCTHSSTLLYVPNPKSKKQRIDIVHSSP
jgi:hypothetical protein